MKRLETVMKLIISFHSALFCGMRDSSGGQVGFKDKHCLLKAALEA